MSTYRNKYGVSAARVLVRSRLSEAFVVCLLCRAMFPLMPHIKKQFVYTRKSLKSELCPVTDLHCVITSLPPRDNKHTQARGAIDITGIVNQPVFHFPTSL